MKNDRFPYEIDEHSINTICINLFKNGPRESGRKGINGNFTIALEIKATETGERLFQDNNKFYFNFPIGQNNIKSIKNHYKRNMDDEHKEFLDDFFNECNEGSIFSLCRWKKQDSKIYTFINAAMVPLNGYVRFIIKIYDEVIYYDVPNKVLDVPSSTKRLSQIYIKSFNFFNNEDEITHYGHDDFLGEDKVSNGLKNQLNRVRGFNKVSIIDKKDFNEDKSPKVSIIDNKDLLPSNDQKVPIIELRSLDNRSIDNRTLESKSDLVLSNEDDSYARARKEKEEQDKEQQFLDSLPKKGKYSDFIEDPDEPGSMIPRSSLKTRNKVNDLRSVFANHPDMNHDG